MIDSDRFQNTIDRFIELYGDRTEAIADEIHAGLAWIGDAKFVLIGGGEAVVFQPSSWRRISRLIDLAEKLRRPVLLWDVLLQGAVTGPAMTLLHKRSAHNSRLHLLKLSVPIIGVFDTLPLERDLAVVDAAVLVERQAVDPQPPAAEAVSTRIRVARDPDGLKSDIVELLSDLSTVPVETLVDQRLAYLRQTVSVLDSVV